MEVLTLSFSIFSMSSWDVARLTVRLGDHNIRTNSEVNHVEKKVKRVVRHRGFDSRTLVGIEIFQNQQETDTILLFSVQ